MPAKNTHTVITTEKLQEFENRLLVSLSICGVNKTKATREAISHGVRFIAETGGAHKGRKANKSKGTPKILSTREALVAAYLESGFAASDSAAKNYADIALLVYAGGVKGLNVAELSPHAAQQLVKNTLLPDAIKVGEFIALVRSEPKAKGKGKSKAKADPKTDAEYLADILAGIRSMSAISTDDENAIVEAIAAK